MNVAIVGYGVEGQSAYRYWVKQHADITICDQNESIEVPDGVATQLGSKYLDNLKRFDVIMRTAGMQPRLILEKNPGVEDKITTVIDEFMRVCPAPIIGVTGTKGKGTTSTLIHKVLQASGKTSHLGGNIGHSPLDFLSEVRKDHWVVLELSSFQLEDARHSPHIAVCLMMVPEHLNWHADFEEYKAAKANIFRFQDIDDIAVYNVLSPASRDIATLSPARTVLAYGVPGAGKQLIRTDVAAFTRRGVIYFGEHTICRVGEVGLIGHHNLENICAAVAATWTPTGGNVAAIRQIVTSFSGLEHRLEFIRSLDGVRYFNDSFSTTPETAIAAINAFEEPKVLIVGGSDKGIPFDTLAESIANHNIRHVLAIGVMGKVIADLLRKRGFEAVTTEGLPDMATIVKTAQKLGKTGDIVLLSPGCASFDMFKDYKDRAYQFKAAVKGLKTRR